MKAERLRNLAHHALVELEIIDTFSAPRTPANADRLEEAIEELRKFLIKLIES